MDVMLDRGWWTRMEINTSIRRLMYAFVALFLLLSLVMVNVQVFQAQALQASTYNGRKCLASNEPLRGSIYDRNGIKLVWSVADPSSPCGYRRQWNPDAVNAGLAPLIGYFSYRYGPSGIERVYDDILSGVGQGSTLQTVTNQLLHQQVHGSDLYLTIDLKLQEQVSALYNQDAETGGPCQAPGSNPAGSITVENPQTGEVLAMYSNPSWDPNRINDDTYWNQIRNDPSSPQLNRAAQGLYDPGSTFKTVTLTAGLDSGKYQLTTPFTLDQDQDQNQDQVGGDGDGDADQDTALYYLVPGSTGGERVTWVDYFPSPGSNGWVGIPTPNGAISVQDGFAYSDNVIFANMAVGMGSDTWLSYVRKFGIATPGTDVTAVPFDSTQSQSRAFTPGAQLTNNLLAESGFGQGQLLISPLTMAEVTSAAAANGNLYAPHVLAKVVTPDGAATTTGSALFSGQPVMQVATAASIRAAMRAVVQYGTAAAGQSVQLSASPAMEGGKTGTGEGGAGTNPQTWWISMAPASSDVNTLGQLVVVVMKEHSGEGACQIFVGDDVYKCAAADHDWMPPADLGPCPAKP
jgi:cell division protein FtsI/penicillin-binding protein 2